MKELKVYTYVQRQRNSERNKIPGTNAATREFLQKGKSIERLSRSTTRSKLFFIVITLNFDLISKKCGNKLHHLKRGTAFKETTKYQNVSTPPE